MFPNIAKNINTQRGNTTMNIIGRVVNNTIRQNGSMVDLTNHNIKSNITLTKADIYKSLEKAYNHASKAR